MSAPKLTRLDVDRELYSRSFRDFIVAAWSEVDPAPFLSNWHIGVLADHLQAVADGRITRLLINIPPGTAKSLIVNVLFPAWLWTRSESKFPRFNRTSRIISASNRVGLAVRDSRKCRNLITSPWYQRLWPTALLDDQNQKIAFENVWKGAREAMPFTSMTGSRGNVVIIDDPHSVKGAKSPASRAEAVETFLEAVPNRVNDEATDAIIVVMQRLHEEDVSGAILDRPDLGYCHLCIPMEAEEPRPATQIGWVDHREPGELLFPTKFSAATIKRLKASQGPFAYAGQYQQRPAPANDGYFARDWFHRHGGDAETAPLCHCGKHHPLPARLNHYITSDHAPGGKRDYNVIRVWGVDEHRNLWLVDSFRARCIMDEALGIRRGPNGMVELASEGALPLIAKYRPLGWYPEGDLTWIAVRGMVKAAMLDTGTFCRIVELPLRGQGDKEGKAQAYQAMASMGKVYLPAGPIGDTALDEYVTFPNGKHDDQVDADGAIARVIAEMLPAFIPITPKGRDPDLDWGRGGGPTDPNDLCW